MNGSFLWHLFTIGTKEEQFQGLNNKSSIPPRPTSSLIYSLYFPPLLVSGNCKGDWNILKCVSTTKNNFSNFHSPFAKKICFMCCSVERMSLAVVFLKMKRSCWIDSHIGLRFHFFCFWWPVTNASSNEMIWDGCAKVTLFWSTIR